ncbi:MAG: D-alanine--D-alanine ligase [Polyangiaceae bacterium]|nr:D-alanine--D-alanine ligase [Polyangiaceae bacterium]MCE7892828.1 D-alanine--D-alanine ligase [Sorangiineae bacterium PRO1]MCL4749252.1 D-alanine--D-alanine ligase [Myxococcales bacterium]
MKALSVAVIAGGPSAEANVSRTSAGAVCAALGQAGQRATVLELEAALPAALREGRFDVAFPVTHGPLGEDGCLQGLLEVLGLPYVGSGVLASALAASKPHAKALFRQSALPLAEELSVSELEGVARAAQRVRERFDGAVVVKPASGGSAIGTTRVDPADERLEAALEAAFAVDADVLVERFVAGLEVTCGVLEGPSGARVLPPTLISAKAADWYDFTSRYRAGGSAHQCPAPLPAAVTARVQEVALAAFRALGCRDLGRADFVVPEGDDPSGVTLLEINTLPGMTSTSLFPEAAAAVGIEFPRLCAELARRAHERPARKHPVPIAMP